MLSIGNGFVTNKEIDHTHDQHEASACVCGIREFPLFTLLAIYSKVAHSCGAVPGELPCIASTARYEGRMPQECAGERPTSTIESLPQTIKPCTQAPPPVA